MADAAAIAPLPPGEEEKEEEDACRICHLPAEADRPLRHPCACRGSIKFVHDDCLLRWLATRRGSSASRCEVCKCAISIAPVYAANAPARLPLPEFMLGLANKLMAWLLLLLCLLFAVCVWEVLMPLTTLWVWRLALSRTLAQVRHLLSLRASAFARPYALTFMPSPDTVLACVSIRRAFLRELPNLRQLNAPARIAADALAPVALWVARLEAHLQHPFGGLDTLQLLALHTIEASLMVVLGDVALALLLGFLPFSLGRIVLCCTSCFSFGGVEDVARSYTSTASLLLVGYGFILMLALLFTGLHTFQQYSRGERLTIAIYFDVLTNLVCWLFSPLRMLPSIHGMLDRTCSFLQHFFWVVISLANVSVNLAAILVMCPLFFGWSLDICTAKLFGVKMPQKLQLLFASSFASTALHWLIGCVYLKLQYSLSSLLRPVLRLGVSAPFLHTTGGVIGEPFYKLYKILPALFLSAIYVAMVILVPVEIAFHLAPTVFPLDITYFDPPIQGTILWQSTRNYAELLSGVLLLKFLLCNALKYLEPGALVQKVLRYWFATTGEALGLSDLLTAQPDGAGEFDAGNSVTPKDQHDRPAEAKDKRRCVAGRMVLLVVLAWLSVVIFNAALLVAPVSVGRALLFAISQLPVAGALKSNDLFAFSIGLCILSTIIAASRDAFAYVMSGRTRLLASIVCNWGTTALKSFPLLFLWAVIIPFLIGLLVDCLLISPFVVPYNEVPVIDFFCTWFLGLQLLKFWIKLVSCNFSSTTLVLLFLKVRWTRVAPFLAYFIDEGWDWKLTQAREDGFSGLRAMWVLRHILMPIIVKLLSALCVPYVLAKGVAPRFGYSAAVLRFAWLGSLAMCVLWYLAKLVCRLVVRLHDCIRDERYLIGQRLQNYSDNM
ncbi:putative E3 ubiquitin ligase SUD1 [Dichanthelium oligosanthes]|uniref:Putative E3 ubiquitin ligase SUD1 n=1 Tax=Dichanthelium oligosanthes TaxID=888268 RepID=A0A1E5V3J4_9POAL|nr:putative E3 ubiquitin ligase SUD1 [Dichanthelium oligosanthes]